MGISDRHQRERSARRGAILAAAAKVFAEHGLEGATVEMVAREAEVGVGTIYLYFCSRDDLYLSLIAERVRHLRARYLEIKSRKLDPAAELRTMSAAYLDYLRESRGLFLTQLSVSQRQLLKELKRKSELDNFKRVMALSREVFGLWESSVRRVYEHGLIDRTLGSARAATILWASLNGAFLLTGDPDAFHDVTGLSTDNFVEEVLEFQLSAASIPLSVFRRGARGEVRRTKSRERQQSDAANAPDPLLTAGREGEKL